MNLQACRAILSSRISEKFHDRTFAVSAQDKCSFEDLTCDAIVEGNLFGDGVNVAAWMNLLQNLEEFAFQKIL